MTTPFWELLLFNNADNSIIRKSEESEIMSHQELIVIMTSLPDLNLSHNIAQILVEEKLAACVQVVPSMISTYLWDGKTCQESEHLVLIKTIASKYESLAARLSTLHPYEVPEIIAIPAIAVEQNYLLWAKSNLV
ncbi:MULTISPECIES: divalent-cation tolerance protein CutA [Pseudanabaena]|uniref:CutA1 divalent ion tolerance protein n=2 Tax=Pseudanabaena TaxID=1152 RepID=L8N8W2_9CYAN|nr:MULTISPECIES: divalent-cation tolerance protein CutA [Pseudanabaena]ELS34663.1 CutA1 divalent ion tolerance protein [Pseudanabaena biceps PCC 7429]MDG3493098.1 divalent-cation tolerance protein CutA [Pseudanabaena catenata USMAC16]